MKYFYALSALNVEITCYKKICIKLDFIKYLKKLFFKISKFK